MKVIAEKLSLIPWLAPYALLAFSYLLLLFQSGLHIPVLLIFSFPVLVIIFVVLHSHAELSLDLDCMYDDGWKAGVKVYLNCYFFTIFCTLPIILIFSGIIYLLS
jgi:hypothetical protein